MEIAQKYYSKKYYEDNKEKIIARSKRQYQENRSKNLEVIRCDCNCMITTINLKRHQRTKKHQKLIIRGISP